MSEVGRQYFSELEKSTLVELVDRQKEIIENKRSDYKNIKAKNEAWESLTEDFNSQSGVKKRESKQLKKCWENIKARAKKAISKEKREAKLTGGGKSTVPDETASAVAAIIPSQVESLTNPFDDDNVNQDEQHDFTVVENEREKPDETPVPSTSSTPTVRAVGKGQLTPAQAQCLAMQQEQHQAELQYIKRKMECLEEEHKRKMDVLDAELLYWQKIGASQKKKKYQKAAESDDD